VLALPIAPNPRTITSKTVSTKIEGQKKKRNLITKTGVFYTPDRVAKQQTLPESAYGSFIHSDNPAAMFCRQWETARPHPGSTAIELRKLASETEAVFSLSYDEGGGEGRGEELGFIGFPLSPALSPLVPRGARECMDKVHSSKGEPGSQVSG
jgi:hypothetical protein